MSLPEKRFTPAVAAAACVGLVVGSIGPWITLGALSVGGIEEGRDGWVTLVGTAIAVLCLGLYSVRGRRALAIATLVIALLMLAVTIYDVSDVQSSSATYFGRTVEPGVGWGLWLATVGSGVLALASVKLLADRRRGPA